MQSNNRTLGGILLVAGTCIGASMIGVPVKTAAAGFYPTAVAYLLMWVLMVITSFLFLELSMSFKGEVNLISMIKEILGSTNKNVAWFVYLLFMYSIMSAYTSGGVTLITQVQPSINFHLGVLIFLLPFMYLIYLGPKAIDLINRFLTFGLIVSFVLLCITALFSNSAHIQKASSFCFIGDLKALLFTIPIIATTFCYHVIIPSLKTYLKEEVKPLKKIILVGTTIPLIVYLTWQLVILILIPVFGNDGLSSMLHANQNPGDSIVNYLMTNGHDQKIVIFITVFLFCALTTSLIGIAWSLFDFLADGFAINKAKKKNKVFLVIFTFLPPVVYSFLFRSGFLKAVGFAAILSAMLTIIYPSLLILWLRNKKFVCSNNNLMSNQIQYRAPFGNQVIIATLLVGIGIVILECINIFY